MARVYLSLGSNIDRYRNISAGLNALAEQFGTLVLSPVYESKAVGFDGDNFLNLVVGIDTSLPVAALSERLKKIEQDSGRRRDQPRFSARTLDIDILTYDQQVGLVGGVQLPREEILHNAFVLLPLADIAPDQCHPVANKTYLELWQAFDQRSQSLWRVDFNWPE